MSVQSRTFAISQNSSLSVVSNYLRSVIGYDAYLIRSIQADSISNQICNLTVYYSDAPDKLIDSVTPNIGAIVSTGNASNEFDLRVLFNKPVDVSSLTSGQFSIDGYGLETSRISFSTGTNNYFAKISASGNRFQSGSVDYHIDSTLRFADGSYLNTIYPGGYTFNGLSSAHIGEEYTTYKRGEVSLGSVFVLKANSVTQAIANYLASINLDSNNLISYTSVDRGLSIQTFFLYISRPEPQIVRGYPQTNSLCPTTALPDKITLTYNVKLNPSTLSTNGLFSIESGFLTSTPISASDITLLADGKTIEIDLSSYITGAGTYSIISRPGLLSSNGIYKQKPEQWILIISSYDAGDSISYSGLTHSQILARGLGA